MKYYEVLKERHLLVMKMEERKQQEMVMRKRKRKK
jgi:hypothetical protein